MYFFQGQNHMTVEPCKEVRDMLARRWHPQEQKEEITIATVSSKRRNSMKLTSLSLGIVAAALLIGCNDSSQIVEPLASGNETIAPVPSMPASAGAQSGTIAVEQALVGESGRTYYVQGRITYVFYQKGGIYYTQANEQLTVSQEIGTAGHEVSHTTTHSATSQGPVNSQFGVSGLSNVGLSVTYSTSGSFSLSSISISDNWGSRPAETN
jgi:hypothetical protein